MKRVCRECYLLSVIIGSPDGGTVECRGHRIQRVKKPYEHIKQYSCDNFKPKVLASDKAEDQRQVVFLRRLAETADEILAEAINRWLGGPPNDVSISVSRGSAMLSVADGDLETFEHDSHFKTYSESNHVFADLLVPAGHVDIPIVFWLSKKNSSGAKLTRFDEPGCYLIALGSEYGFGDVVKCIASALTQQGIGLNAEWFRRVLKKNNVDPNQLELASIVGNA